MRWSLKNVDEAAAVALARETGAPAMIARLLLLRGVRDAAEGKRFLDPRLDDLHSPYSMRGMRAAVTRIQQAIARQERIFIYGDYDVDGTTAVVVLKTAIELLGGTAGFHVPHRIREGYGMKDDVIDRAFAEGYRLLISVDTGIRAFSAAATARRLNLDLIVTDHHLPEAHLGVPDALAVLNPNQAGCEYPCKGLCGAGVAFKLAQALLEEHDHGDARKRLLPSFLKIVAVATIADAVPLVGENRTIAKLGLAGLCRPVNSGLKALMEVAQITAKHGRITASDIGFRLAPRINAAGRMDVAQDVIELFTCRDESRSRALAEKLNTLNGDRQLAEQEILRAIYERLESDAALRDSYCLVIDGEGWHRGVIGITASRVVERTSRPALVLTREGEEAHGSGRSIPAFHLLEALESCAELFTRFGGHAHAVGFSLPCERIPELRSRLDQFAHTRLTVDDFVPALEIEDEIHLQEITPELFHQVKAFEPFGMDNPDPVFVCRNLRVLFPPKILKEKHVKLRLEEAAEEGNGKSSGNGLQRKFDLLGWRKLETVESMGLLAGDICDAAFTLDENDHPDFGGIQLILRDLKKPEPGRREAQPQAPAQAATQAPD